MEGRLSVDRARGGVPESCRTSRLQPPLNRVGDFARRKVSSTGYMCAWAHFWAYGGEIVGRSCPRWCTRELSYKSPPAATQPSWRFRPAEGVEHKVHVSVGTFMCVWSGDGRSIVPEVVYQRVDVQVASSRHSTELAISSGGRCRAQGTCVRGHIFGRMEGRWTVDRARGDVSKSCRTSRLQPPLNRVGDFVRRKVSSTRYMCAWAHLCAYGAEIDGRSCRRWWIRELSYNSAPPAT